MKKISVFFFFFLFPLLVSANSSYLKEFEVLNGTMSIPFQEKNNLYTILLNEGEEEVKFDYELSNSNQTLEVISNQYEKGKENVMILKVQDLKTLETQTYTFYLEREEEISVSNVFFDSTALEVPKERKGFVNQILIIVSCIFIIFLLFKFLIWDFLFKKV